MEKKTVEELKNVGVWTRGGMLLLPIEMKAKSLKIF